MRTEIREKTDNYYVYITDDGTEFYEAKEMKRLHTREIKSTGVLTPDDQYINLYKVESLEDWNYLYKGGQTRGSPDPCRYKRVSYFLGQYRRKRNISVLP